MPAVVVVGGSLKCPHQGTASFTAGNPSCDAGGKAVVVAGMETALTFAATCAYTAPNGAKSPCTNPLSATSGVSTVLVVGGAGVLTDAASGPVVNPSAPPGTWSVGSAGQTTVEVSG